MLTNYSCMGRRLIWMGLGIQGLLFALWGYWDICLDTYIGLHFLPKCLPSTITGNKVVEHLQIDLNEPRRQWIRRLSWVTWSIARHLGLLHGCRNFLASSLFPCLFCLWPRRRHLKQRATCQLTLALRWNLCILYKPLLWAVRHCLFSTCMVLDRKSWFRHWAKVFGSEYILNLVGARLYCGNLVWLWHHWNRSASNAWLAHNFD